jgi:Zinc finger, C3HC4 type (RING finger)
MNIANLDPAASSEKLEAIRLQEKESRQQCERQLAARQAMSDSDNKRLEELGEQLRPYCTCNLCKSILLEPWLIKDCGHLYCFRCLHSIVYEKQVRLQLV